MKSIDNNIEKFIQALNQASDCIMDIRVRVEHEGFKSNNELLHEIGRAHGFLIDAEKYLKIIMEK